MTTIPFDFNTYAEGGWRVQTIDGREVLEFTAFSTAQGRYQLAGVVEGKLVVWMINGDSAFFKKDNLVLVQL